MKVLIIYQPPADPNKVSLDGSFLEVNQEGSVKVSNPIYNYIPDAVEFPQAEISKSGRITFKENNLK